MDTQNMTMEEKLNLIDKSKNLYYNTGEMLMDDATYDALEEELGIANNNYVGSKQGNYTIRHSFTMGSIIKTQVKMDNAGLINWDVCALDIQNTLLKSVNAKAYETTPKLDGCSFSAEFIKQNGKCELKSVATRGNGSYGTDIRHWFEPILQTEQWSMITEAVDALCDTENKILCIRGEVLIPLSVFEKKYAGDYVNPRAFVSGVLGIKFADADEEDIERCSDLHFVCYDYRLYDTDTDTYTELPWVVSDQSVLKPYIGHIGEMIPSEYCLSKSFNGTYTVDDLKTMYDFYNKFRMEKSEYALDGVVIKPECSSRQYHTADRKSPVDCIAMKFIPMLNVSVIENVEWNVKKTGEYFPKAIIKPIVMEDGKTVSKASFFNYNYIVSNNVGIGSKVKISLAGDIIPYIYEVIEHADVEGNINLPEDCYVVETSKNVKGKIVTTKHLMKKFSENEKQKNDFLVSCDVLSINNIGPATASMLYDGLIERIPTLRNITALMTADMYDLIVNRFGNVKSIQNIISSLKQYAEHITLSDVIRSFAFKSCGERAAEVCANIIRDIPYSTEHLSEETYSWAKDKSSANYNLVASTCSLLGINMEADKDAINIVSSNATFVILTGSPALFGYKTKAEFMAKHPNLVETTSWKECQMLITDDRSSTSGKMAKATKAGIPIKTYGEF